MYHAQWFMMFTVVIWEAEWKGVHWANGPLVCHVGIDQDCIWKKEPEKKKKRKEKYIKRNEASLLQFLELVSEHLCLKKASQLLG